MAEKNQIYQLMAAIQVDIEAISKQRKNTQQNYNFRGVEDVLNMMHNLLAKHGVFVVTRRVGEGFVDRRPGSNNKVITTIINDFEFDFCAPDGSKITVGPIPGEGMDFSDKASNKTMANAYKYAMFLTFSIPTQGLVEEPDNESPQREAETASAQRQADIPPGSRGNENEVPPEDYKELRAKLDKILAEGGFDEKEVKQAKAMASKIKPTDASSLANLITAMEKKKSSKPVEEPKGDSVTPEQVAEAVQGELIDDPAKADDFDDDIPF